MVPISINKRSEALAKMELLAVGSGTVKTAASSTVSGVISPRVARAVSKSLVVQPVILNKI